MMERLAFPARGQPWRLPRSCMSDGIEIRGRRILARSTTEADLPDLLAPWNDGRVMKWVHLPEGLGWDMDRMRRWLSRLDDQRRRAHFIVEDEDGRFCGELHYRRVEGAPIYALDIKFRPEAQGRGLAAEAFELLIEHVFATEPDCETVYTEPWPENEAAKTLYRRCGLRPRKRPEVLGEGPSYWEGRKEALDDLSSY